MSLVVTVNSPLERVRAVLEPTGTMTELTINGYPALRDRQDDSLICTVYVEISEDQVVSIEVINFVLHPPVPACEQSRRGSEAAIDALAHR